MESISRISSILDTGWQPILHLAMNFQPDEALKSARFDVGSRTIGSNRYGSKLRRQVDSTRSAIYTNQKAAGQSE